MNAFTRREALAAGAVARRRRARRSRREEAHHEWPHQAIDLSPGASCRPARSGRSTSSARSPRIWASPRSSCCRPEQFATLKKHGLTCAIASNTMPGSFKTGFNNPKYHDELIERTTQGDRRLCRLRLPERHRLHRLQVEGRRWTTRAAKSRRDEGAENCVKGLKADGGHAEKKGVNVCIEHLNTRDDSHPMKGHPGYQGDDLDYLAKIIRSVGSPRMKLLFDVYHVQIMHGDVIRRLEQCKDIIGHVHTAGNPGRGELDDTQEINYPPIMRKLLAIKYGGFVGQEFIPTRDPKAGLARALRVCDV